MKAEEVEILRKKCRETGSWRPSKSDLLRALEDVEVQDDSKEVEQRRQIADLKKENSNLHKILKDAGIETFTDRGGNLRYKEPRPKKESTKPETKSSSRWQ